MTEGTTTDHDPHVTHFDRDRWRVRLQPGTKNNPGGNGYLAVVVDIHNRNAITDKPAEVFNSRNAHHDAGVFEDIDKALRYAERWRDGRVAQLAREHELRLRRGMELGERLHDLGLERGHLEQERKALGTRLKSNEDAQRRLVEEAREPKVELELRPTSDSWRIFDAPSESDGTFEGNSRQLVLEQTGLEPIVPVETEDDSGEPPPPPTALHAVPDAPSEDNETEDKGRKLPPSVKGRDGKACKPGQWVEVLSGAGEGKVAASGFLVQIARPLKGGAYGVVVVPFDGKKPGTPSNLANHQIRKAKKPRGLKAPAWDDEAGERAVVDRKGERLEVGSFVAISEPGAGEDYTGTVTSIGEGYEIWFALVIEVNGPGAPQRASTRWATRLDDLPPATEVGPAPTGQDEDTDASVSPADPNEPVAKSEPVDAPRVTAARDERTEQRGPEPDPWPKGVTDKGNASLRRGSWVETDDEPPLLLKLTGAWERPEGGHRLEGHTEAGDMYETDTTEVTRAKKPRAKKTPPPRAGEMRVVSETVGEPTVEPFVDDDGESKPRPGLNPADVVWPEDDGGPEL